MGKPSFRNPFAGGPHVGWPVTTYSRSLGNANSIGQDSFAVFPLFQSNLKLISDDMPNDDGKLDQLADEFEAIWQTGTRPNLKSFLINAAPELRGRLAKLIIPIDVEYRMKRGESISVADYCQPGSKSEQAVRRLLRSSLDSASDGSHEQLDATLGTSVVSPEVQDTDATLDSKTARIANDETDFPSSVLQLHSSKTKSVPQQDTSNSQPVIGPYRLLRRLGEGGMGTVWMAEQSEPVRRRVALKVIKAGLDNKQVIARFEAERQAVAMMNHENICKILDAGTTDSGQPYFVMELVQGLPFNQYCDDNKLGIKERLELFVPVCHAVQHAHQKGIIHRDLKPSNVLVSVFDGKPVPKIIDFGLAKALEHQTKLTDKTMFTEFGQVVGTLQYMSPEQAEMSQLDIDTRTDIYSLGVMLYELLAGSTPIDSDSLKGAAIFKVLETIREKDPPRPSARLSSQSNEAVMHISSHRQIDARKLKNILHGDLDWIVMKSIEKDRRRRYETANDFAEDIGCYLDNDVVSARPPSATYRASKFVQKNRGLVAAAAAIFGLLLLGIGGTTYGMLSAQTESGKRIAADKAYRLAEKQREQAKLDLDSVSQEQKRIQQQVEKLERDKLELAVKIDKAAEQKKLNEMQAQEAMARAADAMSAARKAMEETEVAQKRVVQARSEIDTIMKQNSQRSQPITSSAINEQMWNLVARSTNDGQTVSQLQLAIMRVLVDEEPKCSFCNTLAVAEYRNGNYLEAISAARLSIESSSAESNPADQLPVSLAIKAMSHFKLGETDEAERAREKLGEAMKRKVFLDDKDCQSFVKEVGELLDPEG